MLGIKARGVAALLLGVGIVATVLAPACAEKKSALMLAINTDMRAPKDVNAVSVTISTNGAIKHSFIGRVTPQGEVLLPATLAVVEADDPSALIRVRVMAFQDRKPRVLRDVRTTAPGSGRTALLRIPLNFVNDNSAVGSQLPEGVVPAPIPTASLGAAGGTTTKADPPGGLIVSAGDFDFFGAFQPPCPNIDTETIIDGVCHDSFIDSSSLPDFESALIGDSTDKGSCFDVAKCFAGALTVGEGGEAAPAPVTDGGGAGTPDAGTGAPAGDFDAGAKFKDLRPSAVTLDRGTCSLQLNGASPERLNVALVTPDIGECVRPGECYVPIERGGAAGWQADGGRAKLPPFVCKLVTDKGLRLATSSEICAAKEEKNPICAPQPGEVPVAQCEGSKRPPEVQPVAPIILKLTKLNLGNLDPATGLPSDDAWKSVGFDLDGLCTTSASTDVCTRAQGAPATAQEDGHLGIDNTFGRAIVPQLGAIGPDSYLQLDGGSGGTLHVALPGAHLTLPLHDVQLEPGPIGESATGTLGALLLSSEVAAAVSKVAGNVNPAFCDGSGAAVLSRSIQEASDMPAEGNNRAGATCGAISLGMTFTGTPVGVLQLPPAVDPCIPRECPKLQVIDAPALPWKLPFSSPGDCTQLEVDNFVAWADANPGAPFTDVKKTTVLSPTCRSCVFGLESDQVWRPILEDPAGNPVRVNRGACVALYTGDDMCGKAYQNLFDCGMQACSDCDPTALTSCRAATTSSSSGPCKSGFDARTSACISLDPSAMCPEGKYGFEASIVFQCINGPG